MTCTPTEWCQGVFKTFDHQLPGWRNHFDGPALELTLVDLEGGNKPNELDPVRLDALSEFMAALRSSDPYAVAALNEAVAKAAAHPALPDVLQRIGTLFRPGQPLQHPELRSRRVAVLREFLEILTPVARPVLLRYADKLDYEEERHTDRTEQMTRPDLVKAREEEAAREASLKPRKQAAIVLEEMGRTLNSKALKALRTFLAAGGTRSMMEVAKTEGVPEPTMSRAVAKLGVASMKVLRDADRDERLAFVEALSKTA